MSGSVFSIEQRHELVSKFNRRKINCDEFCKIHKVSRVTIYKWRRDFFAKTKEEKFIPLEIISTANTFANAMSTAVTGSLSKITSPIKITGTSVTVDFVNGCKIEELKAILRIMNAS